jgi:hypothetical protein
MTSAARERPHAKRDLGVGLSWSSAAGRARIGACQLSLAAPRHNKNVTA